LQIYNSTEGLAAEVRNENGRRFITLTSSKLDVQRGFTGTARLQKVDIDPRSRQSRVGLQFSLPEYIPATYSLSTNSNGEKQCEVELPDQSNCVGYAKIGGITSRFDVILLAPAVLLYAFGLSGPLYIVSMSALTPVEYLPERPLLEVSHGSGRAGASISPADDGGLDIATSLSGDGYSKGELFIRRSFSFDKSYIDEPIGIFQSGSSSFKWTPARHDFDFVAVVPPIFESREMMSEFFRALGATISSPGGINMRVDLVCDGPGIDYYICLRGHRLLHSDESVSKIIASATS
jgi:hypothetical protein